MTICQDIALPFHQIPVTPVPCWDKEKPAGLVLRGQESDRFIEDVQGELEGLVFGSNLSQPHLTAEEYWNQWSGAVRRAGQSFSAGNTQTSGKTRRTQLQSCGSFSIGSGGSHGHPVVWVSPRNTYQHCLSFGEISAFWTARRKLDVLTRRDRQRSQEATITSF